jgi:hypothetical protein
MNRRLWVVRAFFCSSISLPLAALACGQSQSAAHADGGEADSGGGIVFGDSGGGHDATKGDGGAETGDGESPPDASGDVVPSCEGGETRCGSGCSDLQSDAKNCGRCGHDCQGGQCSAATCQPFALASGQKVPLGIAVDSTSVYWVDYGGNTVMKVALNGGSPVTLDSPLASSPFGIAADSTSVYWTNQGSTVAKVGLDGSGATVIASGQLMPQGVVVASGEVFWTNATSPGAILKVSTSGGTISTLATGQNYPTSLAVDTSSVYWTNHASPGALMTTPISGNSAAVTLASGQSYPNAVAVDSTNVYWTNEGGGVVKLPVGGTVPATLASGTIPYAIAIDTTSVYWTDLGNCLSPPDSGACSGSIMAVPIAGGAAKTLATVQNTAQAIAVDATSVYWTIASMSQYGTVMKVAKP